MKRFVGFLLLSFLTLGFMISSCDQEPAPSEDPGKEEQKPEEKPEEKPDPKPEDETPTGPQAGTYKFVASPLKGTWQAGDQIYVHGNLGTATETVTLSAEDISQDGKTATARLGDEVVQSYYDPDGLYAAWPAEAVYQFKGILKIRCRGKGFALAVEAPEGHEGADGDIKGAVGQFMGFACLQQDIPEQVRALERFFKGRGIEA